MPHSLRLAASVALAGFVSAALSSAALAQGVDVSRNSATGLVGWMSNPSGLAVESAAGAGSATSYEQAALDFLGRQSDSFGLRQGAAELTAARATEDGAGRGFVRVQQNYKGLPIVGAELMVQMDSGYNVMSVNGRSVGDVNVSTEPAVTAEEARAGAVGAAARAHGVSVLELNGSDPVLSIHDARVMGGPAAAPTLVWRVEVTSKTHIDIDQFVLINARNGRVAVQFNQTPHAVPPANATQRLCDAANSQNKLPCDAGSAIKSPTTSKVDDVKKAYEYSEKAYDFYAKRFYRNSLDNKGMTLISTMRWQKDKGVDLANAFWSSQLGQMIYGKGYAAAEDVVGHELAHGLTSFTSKLFYYYQSGALNESISDIFGELSQRVDNKFDFWLLGERLPGGAVRDMMDPTNPTYGGQPDKMTSTLWTGDFTGQDDGGVHTNSGVGNKFAYLVTDGATFNGQTVKGIGIDKAAAIFYRVNTYLLTSASDYADFGNALKQACKDLTGRRPRDKTGKEISSSVSTTDCKQVELAVLATEMNKQPQWWPIPTEARYCPAGKAVKSLVTEKFEDAPSKWLFKPLSNKYFALSNEYAASNTRAAVLVGTGEFIASLAQVDGAKLPSKPYLRFAHFHNFRYNFEGQPVAGGIIEYSVTAGKWVKVPPSMFLDNPYNGTVVNSGKLANQKAFVGFTGGWTSSRLDLSSLAGKTVKFRFRVGTNNLGAGEGWYLDDIRLYSCITN